MFNIIRIVLWAVIVLMLLCMVKFTHIKRRTAVLMVIVCTGMVVISGIFPTENLFIKFRSPYDVFHYVMSGDVKGLLNGKNSCAVIYSDGKYDGGNLIIPKVEDGYQIPNYFMSKRVSHRFDRNGTFDIYQVSETEDYYLFGTVLSTETDIRITDVAGRPAGCIITEMGNDNVKNIYLYMYTDDLSDFEFLIINGEKVPVFKS